MKSGLILAILSLAVTSTSAASIAPSASSTGSTGSTACTVTDDCPITSYCAYNACTPYTDCRGPGLGCPSTEKCASFVTLVGDETDAARDPSQVFYCQPEGGYEGYY